MNDEAGGQAMDNQKKHTHRYGRAILIGLGLGCVLGLALAAFDFYSRWQLAERGRTILIEENIGRPSPSTAAKGEQTDGFGSYVMLKDGAGNETLKNYSQSFSNGNITVNWQRGAKPLTFEEIKGYLEKIDPTIENNQVLIEAGEDDAGGMIMPSCLRGTTSTSCQLHIYEAGVIEKPTALAGEKLYWVFRPGSSWGGDVSFINMLALWDDVAHRFVVIQPDGLRPDAVDTRFVSGIIEYQFPELTLEREFTIPGFDGIPVVFSKSRHLPDDLGKIRGAEKNHGGILGIAGHTIVPYEEYKESDHVFSDARMSVYFTADAYHVILPDGSVQLYELKPEFLKSDIPDGAAKDFYPTSYVADIVWTDGRTDAPETRYVFGGRIGTNGLCSVGVIPCTNIVSKEPWFKVANLVPVGKTKQGESVYALKDAETNAHYRSLFEFGYASSKLSEPGSDPLKVSESLSAMSEAEKYTDFLAQHPMFFWKDFVGNWRVYQKSMYQSMAECGKPVIYLYPTKETTVRVRVEPTGGFTKVEPEYPDGGWVVRAKPNGELTNITDGKKYPYLFWEGIGYDYARPREGFVLTREQVPSEMRGLLAQLGLSEKEARDFMEFWKEKLMVKPYVFVTFLPEKQFDAMAPLTVSPRPDTVIRVFMDYEPLDAPAAVAPLRIQTPERNGFTVVEWGGVLHHELKNE